MSDALDSIICQFPPEFGLRAFPGKRFCISRTASYISDNGDSVVLYVFVKQGDQWLSFAKGSPEELRREVI